MSTFCYYWESESETNQCDLSCLLAEMVVEKLPSAVDITPDRVHKLLYSAVMDHDTLPPQTQHIRKGDLHTTV